MTDQVPDLHDLTMDDLRALSDAALNVVVARARGWRIERRSEALGDHEIYSTHVIVRPDGSEYEPLVIEKFLGSEFQECIPNVAGDLNAAWALCAGLDHTVRYDSTENTNYGMIELGSYGDYEYRCFEERAETPARALTLAWCAWRKDEDADGEGE